MVTVPARYDGGLPVHWRYCDIEEMITAWQAYWTWANVPPKERSPNRGPSMMDIRLISDYVRYALAAPIFRYQFSDQPKLQILLDTLQSAEDVEKLLRRIERVLGECGFGFE